jgi:hypothetical protein
LVGCLAGFAAAASAEGRYAQAVRLCAAAVALREQTTTRPPPAEADAVEQVVTSARSVLGPLYFEKEWQTGTVLTQGAAISEALEE